MFSFCLTDFLGQFVIKDYQNDRYMHLLTCFAYLMDFDMEWHNFSA